MNNKRLQAFTLMEIMPAIIIAAIVVVTALSSLRITERSRSNQQYYSQLHSSIRTTFDIIDRDLNCIFRHPDPKLRHLEITSSSENNASRISFYTISTRHPQLKSDIIQVEFGLTQYPDLPNRWLGYRIAQLENLTDTNEYGKVIHLVDNVKSFNIQCYDSSQWLTKWDQTDTWPEKIKIKIVIADHKSHYPDYIIERTFIIEPLPKTPEPKEPTSI
ncbi:MAG: hypothetical protein JEZ07_00025 [Phycisphaerae bacterium]|nr:hypothetical protein [Phycisphaerae bacterium]